jgi:UDP-N-acetylmuramoyl-tripeptide--D-alanyl-D-alanine ligase
MKIRLGLSEMDARDVAVYCAGALHDNRIDAQRVSFVCTDSREADGESMFVATRGERVDGHDYISRALDRGCRCILCERIPEEVKDRDAAFITVKDSIEAFSLCAKGYRAQRPLGTVAITGSVGKTTTKELTAAIFRLERKVYATEGNFNSVIGMPMSLMEVEADRDTAVFEMGMSAPGEISSMTRAATPDVAMVINVGSSHLEYLKTRDNIALAKLEIAEGIREGGTLLLNGDEPLLCKHVRSGNYRVLYIGSADNSDITVKNIRVGEGFTELDLDFMGKTIKSLKINLIGKQFATNAAFAASSALIMGISEGAVREGLASYLPGAMRQSITLREGITVIADCYNAAPESMRAAIDTLMAISVRGKRIAVLGDMRELGEGSEGMHREIGEYLTCAGVDMLFTLGASGEYIADAAKSAGMDAECISAWRDTDNIEGICAAIKEKMGRGDAILFKASRGVALERAMNSLFEAK